VTTGAAPSLKNNIIPALVSKSDRSGSPHSKCVTANMFRLGFGLHVAWIGPWCEKMGHDMRMMLHDVFAQTLTSTRAAHTSTSLLNHHSALPLLLLLQPNHSQHAGRESRLAYSNTPYREARKRWSESGKLGIKYATKQVFWIDQERREIEIHLFLTIQRKRSRPFR